MAPVTPAPTAKPTPEPTVQPTEPRPTAVPTPAPTAEPTTEPAPGPTSQPTTPFPTAAPTSAPTLKPTSAPTPLPTKAVSATKTVSVKEKEVNKNTKALVFEIEAHQEAVVIEAFSLLPKDSSKIGVCEVYFGHGSYQKWANGGLSSNEWTKIYDDIPQVENDKMKVEITPAITILAGGIMSFDIACKQGVMYVEGDKAVVMEDLSTLPGSSMKKQFSEVKGDAEYAGEVQYRTELAKVTSPPSLSPSISTQPTLPPHKVTSPPTSSPTKHPTSHPTNPGGTREITVGDKGPGVGTVSLMFSIKAHRNIKMIKSIDVFGTVDKDGEEFKIYYQHQAYDANNRLNGWKFILKSKLAVTKGEITTIDLSEAIINIHIDEGEEVSFYINSKKTAFKYTEASEANDEL